MPSPLAAGEQSADIAFANVSSKLLFWPFLGKIVPIATILRVTMLAFIISLSVTCLNAQDPQTNSAAQVDWLTGSLLDQAVKNSMSLAWTDAPVGLRLRAFAEKKRIAIFLDRRVDPMQRADLKVVNVTVEQFFFRVADAMQLGTCRIGDCWYFGPMATAQSLPTAWQTLPTTEGTAPTLLQWPRLSTPESILATITRSGVRLRNPAAIPHDLWLAGKLPNLAPAEQLAVIAIGFGQWPRPTRIRNEFELVRFEPITNGRVLYPRDPADQAKPKTLRSKLRQEFGDCKFRVTRTAVEAQGPTQDLYEVKRFLAEQITPNAGDKRFTLTTAATRLQILQAIAKQTDRQLDFPPSLRTILKKRVPIQCDQVSLQELVDLILKGTKLTGEVSVTTIKLSEKQAGFRP